jgi:dolichyl-phosphate beta-glucosyltransferase
MSGTTDPNLHPGVGLVVPCYNEADRLEADSFGKFALPGRDLRFVFVNDGSADTTVDVLRSICSVRRDSSEILDVQPNQGKAEAVRRGLLRALETGVGLVGFWDADLATPLFELEEFCRLLDQQPAVDLVLGSRVRLLGRRITRSPVRHYLGRIFATGASLALGLPVYDTQCGAKLFRATDNLRTALARPFTSRWVFDVELLARYSVLQDGGRAAMVSKVYEIPLTKWTDVDGSKVRFHDFFWSGLELARIWYRYRA